MFKIKQTFHLVCMCLRLIDVSFDFPGCSFFLLSKYWRTKAVLVKSEDTRVTYPSKSIPEIISGARSGHLGENLVRILQGTRTDFLDWFFKDFF